MIESRNIFNTWIGVLLSLGLGLMVVAILWPFGCIRQESTASLEKSFRSRVAALVNSPSLHPLDLVLPENGSREILLPKADFIRIHGNLADSLEYMKAQETGWSHRFYPHHGPFSLALEAVAFLEGGAWVWYYHQEYRDVETLVGGVMARTFLVCLGLILIGILCIRMLQRRCGLILERHSRWLTQVFEGNEAPRAPGPHNLPGGSMLWAALLQARESHESELRYLQRQFRELQSLLSHMDEGLLVLDQSLHVKRLNPAAARLLGTEDSLAIGTSLSSLVQSSSLLEALDRCKNGGGAIEVVVAQYRGPAAWLKIHGNLLPAEEDSRENYMLLLSDISELKRLEQIRTDFVSNVSHELRTPITSILGFAETLAQDGEILDSGLRSRFTTIILRQSRRMQHIIEDLLSLSRIEQLGGEVSREPCRSGAIVHSAVEICGPRIEKRAVAPTLAVVDFALEANPGLLEQALVNLLGNALAYTPPDCPITLSCKAEGGHGIFEVADKGPGIPQKDRTRIFERFYRVDKARSREEGGTGLGLSIVRHIALVHGGEVELDTTPGQGCTFRIRIPLIATTSQAIPDQDR